MELVKENKEKKRTVYFDKDRFRKVWKEKDKADWIYRHVKILNHLMPGYVLSYGVDYIEYKPIEGILANKFEHTDEFIRKIYNFCLDNIKETRPWVHGDWVLSNIVIKSDKSMALIDWDNVGMYLEQDYMEKLHKDLSSAFGEEKFLNAIK